MLASCGLAAMVLMKIIDDLSLTIKTFFSSSALRKLNLKICSIGLIVLPVCLEKINPLHFIFFRRDGSISQNGGGIPIAARSLLRWGH